MAWSFFGDKQQSNRHKSRRRARNGRAGIPGRRRPLFEELEQRHLLAVLTVNSAADVIAADGVVTLREAIVASNNDTITELGETGSGADIIQFAPGFGPAINLVAQLVITDSATINGPGAASLTINAGPASRIFNITDEAGDVTIKGLRLTGGAPGAGQNGGAILSDAFGLLTIQDSVISGNTAGTSGGGIYADGDLSITGSTIGSVGSPNTATTGNGGGFVAGGILTVKNSTIAANVAGFVGGGFSAAGVNVSVENSTIGGTAAGAGNRANSGGGIFARSVNLVNVTVAGNTATTGAGGGIAALANATVKNSTFSGNTAGSNGGGIFTSDTATVENSTVGGINAAAGNKSGTNGGGIFAQGNLLVLHSTVSFNEATLNGNGGGIFTPNRVTLRNSTVSNNRAEDDGGGIHGANVTIHNSTIAFNTADFNNGTVGTGGGAFVTGRFRMPNSIVIGNFDFDNGNPDLNIPALAASTVRFSLIGDNTGLPPAAANPQFTVTGPAGPANAFGNRIGMPGGANAIAPALVLDPAGLQNNGGPTPTIALFSTSLAVDAGRNSIAPNVSAGDQRGLPFARIFGPKVDMGAFEFQIIAPNANPVVNTPIPDQTAIVGSPFVFTFSATAFTDPDFDALTYTATLSPTGALPAWLTFTQGNNGRTFVGVPAAADVGTITIRVTASDGKGGLASDDFTLTVVAAALPFTENFNVAPLNPQITQRIASITRTTTAPIEGAGSLRAERIVVGSRPLATVDFPSPATAATITHVKVDVNMEPGNGGSLFANALIVFDYQNNDNYKFAGVFEIIDKLIIGQVVNGQVQYLKQVVFPSLPNTVIPLDLTIDRTTRQVTLRSGATAVSHTFALLGSGTVGLGTLNANTRFDSLLIS